MSEFTRMISVFAFIAQIAFVYLFLTNGIEEKNKRSLSALGWAVAATYTLSIIVANRNNIKTLIRSK